MVPGTFGDHGTFVSVAERLLAGDQLYVEVHDNKDPLFYYLLAAGRLVLPFADFVLEVMWILVAAIALLTVARRAGVSRTTSSMVAFAGTPLVLTGVVYEAGMTHLPGNALTLVACALAVRSRWILAGVAVAAVAFLKVTLVPVATVAVVTLAVRRRAWPGLARGAAGAFAGALTLVGVIWARGELGGWLTSFRDNAVYAEGDLFDSQYGSTVGHLLRAFPTDGRNASLVTLLVIVLALSLVQRRGAASPLPPEHGEPATREPATSLSTADLWDLTMATSVAAVLVLASTATWQHHAQTLYTPALLALVLVSARWRTVTAWWRTGLVVVITALLAGGAAHPYTYLEELYHARRNLASLEAASPESVVVLDSDARTYARAGGNDVRAHANGLDGLELVCARFHQYPFDPPKVLDEVASCLPRADVLIVDDTLVPEEGSSDWNAYVERVTQLVATGYDCVASEGARVCFRED